MGLCLAASTFAAYLIRALVVDPEAASEADDEHDEDGVYCQLLRSPIRSVTVRHTRLKRKGGVAPGYSERDFGQGYGGVHCSFLLIPASSNASFGRE